MLSLNKTKKAPVKKQVVEPTPVLEQEQKPKLTRQARAVLKVEDPQVSDQQVEDHQIEDPKPKKPRKASYWLLALKRWNASQTSYRIPKKGSEEYTAVKKIEEDIRASDI